MKKILITALCMTFYAWSFSQTILISAGGTVNVNGGETFYDAGGAAGNDGNTSYTITLCPSNGNEKVAVDFSYFKTMWNDDPFGGPEEDALFIYNGTSATGNNIGKLMGDYSIKYNNGATPYGMGVEANGTFPLIDNPTIFSSTHASGCLTFQFVNGSSSQYPGWVGNVSVYKPLDTPGCNIDLTPDTTICNGESVTLFATGTVVSAPINSDFNASSIGTGWSASPSASFTSNVCSSTSLDNSVYLWMQNATAPRSLESNNFDVSNGGTISFEYRQAINNGNASPCESPDQQSGTFEGIYVQYSTNSGATWTTFKYIFPNGTEGSFGAEAALTGCGDYVKGWTKMTYPIPAAAQTSNTKFRWIQSVSTSASTDNWGLDNVIIATPLNTTLTITDLSTNTVIASGTLDELSLVVSPTTTTSYRATVSDGISTCSKDITVTIGPCGTPCNASSTMTWD